ncbi:3'5'-cyclic nucleotide phosphodiesterase domain-containing protein [Besnoitia besnoiti]|uniref:Phosphodiesterase n=1 Tax=Besnoitia besnoiti TaxID=94643 RepID=A0A2A9MLJ4_BESBE|nr:3'5'-cyclic nucleotide phosphodiesterase domain-containing protein [Besnoitia besnoiti]PFH36573.1 3'5'-cyclic nucleotide phosphodiesterase domain-containing protein [Besnoitia besnoiti]
MLGQAGGRLLPTFEGEIGWTTIVPFLLFSAILGGIEWPKFALITIVESLSVVVSVSILPTKLPPCSRIPLQVFNIVAMIIANFTVRRLEIYRRLRYLEYRFAAGQLRLFEDEAARFIQASPAEDAFYCVKECERLLSEQLYSPGKGVTTTQALYNCILYLTRAEIKLSLFDEHAATDPFLFYLEEGPSASSADTEGVTVPHNRQASPPSKASQETPAAVQIALDKSRKETTSGDAAEDTGWRARRQKEKQAQRGTSESTTPKPLPPAEDALSNPVKAYRRKQYPSGGRRTIEESRKTAYREFGNALASTFGLAASARQESTLLGSLHDSQGRPGQSSASTRTAEDTAANVLRTERSGSVSALESIDDTIRSLVEGVGVDWDLDMFELCKKTNRMTLMAAGFWLRQYRHNPYHNEQHGAAVAHMVVFLLCACHAWQMYRPLHQAAIIVGALVHDVGHFGMNNNYVVNSSHPLAITYNDRSVLESFHSALAFRIMNSRGNDEVNIAEAFLPEDKKEFRKYIIELVLETDIFFHYEFVSRFRLRRQMSSLYSTLGEKTSFPNGDQNIVQFAHVSSRTRMGAEEDTEEDAKDLVLLAKACLRSADVGHAAVEWRQHYLYSKAVQTEFFNQGKKEKEMGLRISPCCDPDATDVAKCQDGFITFISRPIFDELSLINPSGAIMQKCVPLLNGNLATWNRIKAKGIQWDSDEALQEGLDLASG